MCLCHLRDFIGCKVIGRLGENFAHGQKIFIFENNSWV